MRIRVGKIRQKWGAKWGFTFYDVIRMGIEAILAVNHNTTGTI